MRSKRITTLLLSAVMALTTVAMVAPAASADYDEHPNIVVQAAIRLDNIAATSNNYRKANQSLKLLKDIRHWQREHNAPMFVRRGQGPGGECKAAYDAWLVDTRALARIGFRYYRGQATKWQEYPGGWERQAVKVRNRLMFNRIVSNQADATDDFVDECILSRMPRRARGLFF